MSVEVAHRLDGPDGAPLLVLSNSLGTTTRLWEPQLRPFTERFRVLRHDHPGHGESPVPPEAFAVEDVAGALLDLVDELGADRFSFCGLSLGGMVGMCLAARAPERIDALTLCCTGAKLGARAEWLDRAASVRAGGTAAVLDRAHERWFTPRFRDSETARTYFDELRTIPAEGYARCCEAIGNFDFRHELGRIEAPTLVMAGADDPAVSAEVTELLARGIPRAETVVVAQAAHLANIEQPDLIATAVLRHLEARAAA